MATSVQARTGERRRAATQQDLLDATKRLLEDPATTMASLSIADIVKEAGVVRTTFYLHFKDKLALVNALAEEQLAWIEAVGRGDQQVTTPVLDRETVRRIVGEIVSRWVENRHVLSAIIETAERDPHVEELWRAGIHQIADVAESVFAGHWQADPRAAPGHPGAVAEVLTWMIERSCHQIAREPGRADEVASALAEVIWRTLGPAAQRAC